MRENCEECRRLRRAYAAAATIQLTLEDRLQLATLSCESEAIAALTLQIEAVALKRASADKAMAQHELAANHAEDVISAPQ